MLNSKQRAYLMSLGSEEAPVLQIGKGGVTPETVVSAEEVFNRRELFNGSILKTCPDLPETYSGARDLRRRQRSCAQLTGQILYSCLPARLIFHRRRYGKESEPANPAEIWFRTA